MTAFESCCDPFQIPGSLHIPQTMTCQVSSFGSEISDKSMRASVRDEESVFEDIQHLSAMERPKINRKPLPPKLAQLQKSKIPGEFPISPPMEQKPRGWGEEWIHLARDTSSNAMSGIASSGSVWESSNYTKSSYQSSETSFSRKASRPRNVTPSSSISNLSRRSPLSTMRYALKWPTKLHLLNLA